MITLISLEYWDHADSGESITKDQIEAAVEKLYGSTDVVSDGAWEFLDDVIEDGDYDKLYELTTDHEHENDLLINEIEQNPDFNRTESVNDILAEIHSREDHNTNDHDPID